MAILGALALEQSGQTLQGLLGVDNAGGVVRGVDDDALGVGGDALFNLVQVDLEGLGIGGHHDHLRTVGGDEGAVLGEERSNDHDLGIAVDGQGLDDGDERGSGAAGEEQLAALDIQTEAVGQILGNGVTRGVEAGGHGITVQLDGVGLIDDLLDGLVDLLGSGDAGVAERIVIDLLGADLRGLLQAIGEQLTDNGGRSAQVVILLINHNFTSPLFYLLL